MSYGQFIKPKSPKLHLWEAKITFFDVEGQSQLLDFLTFAEGATKYVKGYELRPANDEVTLVEAANRKYIIRTDSKGDSTLTLRDFNDNDPHYKNARDLMKKKLDGFKAKCAGGGISI